MISALYSFLICVYKFASFVQKIVSYGQSEFYRRLLGADKCYIKFPGSILNPRYMHCKYLVAREGLRIELIDKYEDEVYSPELIIGDGFNVGANVHIGVIESVRIGKGVLLGSNILIVDHNHGCYYGSDSSVSIVPIMRKLSGGRRIVIGDNVWIGDGCVILPGAKIGNNAVLGANSVVSGVIPNCAVVAPNRSAVIREFVDGEWLQVK